MDMIANSNVVKIFEKNFPALGIGNSRQDTLLQQDQMLDQVFAVANNSQETLFIKEDMGTLKEQNWGTNDKNNKRLMMVGQHSVPSPMTLTLRHQVGIRHRLLSLLHVQVAIRGKQDTKLVKARFFGRWRSRTVVGTVREL